MFNANLSSVSEIVCHALKESGKKIKVVNDQIFKVTKSHYLFTDVKKMPLGKLGKTQIAKGFKCLDEIEKALNAKKPRNTLTALSSKFYTLIPHDFGRRIPPAIDDLETLRSKMDMLLVKIMILSCFLLIIDMIIS